MSIPPESFKGITFIQISNLPSEQKEEVRKTFPRSKIIKILKGNATLSGCILYDDYQAWYADFARKEAKKIEHLKDHPSGSSINFAFE